MSVLVLEPEVRACSVVSSRSSSLFCTMTSVYFCFFYVLYIFLSIPHLAPLYPFFRFPFLPAIHSPSPYPPTILLAPCCREYASPLAKLNHFHSWTHTSRTELTRRSRASLYVIRAPALIAYLFFTLTYIALQEYSYPITPIFFLAHTRPAY